MATKPPHVIEAILMLLVLALVAVGTTAGYIVGHVSKATKTAVAAPGHEGAGLPVTDFGDPALGATLFDAKGCADCHSYGGQGGTDAPPLDFMAGHLSAREVANMSGRIWNHLPAMLGHFKEEGLAVPTFQGDEMANLVAYLHSKSMAGDSRAGTSTGGTGMQMGDQTTTP